MKFWPWSNSPDYAIKVDRGSRGKWRWSLIHRGDTVALSPVKGWDTAEEARDAATKCSTTSAPTMSRGKPNEEILHHRRRFALVDRADRQDL